MVDMKNFTLTKHDPELYNIITPINPKSQSHKVLAQWTIDCLNRVVSHFYHKYSDDKVIFTAIDYLKQWIDDKIKMWDARKYKFDVLKKAKSMVEVDKTFSQILRATSHALATVHVHTHSERVAMYIINFIKLNNANNTNVYKMMENERKWQIQRLKDMLKDFF